MNIVFLIIIILLLLMALFQDERAIKRMEKVKMLRKNEIYD